MSPAKFLVIWLVMSVVVAVSIFHSINSETIGTRLEALASLCDARSKILQSQFKGCVNQVHAMSILISTYHHGLSPSAIDQKTFASYAERTANNRPLTSGVAYAVRILQSEREQFEKQQGWTIKQMDKVKKNPVHKDDYRTEALESSPIREEYAPVIFAQETVAHVISVDMLSGEEDRENVLRARASGKAVLTKPFKLLKTNRLGVIVTFAVYKTELPADAIPSERINATLGYLGGIFDVESLVEKLLLKLSEEHDILVDVYDVTNSSEPISMYGSSVPAGETVEKRSLNFGDPSRQHEMQCRFKEKAPVPWLAISNAFGGFVIASLTGYILYCTFNHKAKAEYGYHEMMELKKRAEDSDVTKSQFLATVSHEMRTPMNGVLGMLQLLMDTTLDATQLEFVRTAQTCGKALVSLINEVLDQAKIKSGKLELEAVCFDMRNVLDDVLSLFSEKSRDKGVELAVYISENVPEKLVGDPGRFRQIITNLVGNSIKFTEKGHIFVTVHLVDEVINSLDVYPELSSKNTLSGCPVTKRQSSWANFRSLHQDTFINLIKLIVSVEDTGSGIPLDAQPRIFTPFMQVGPSIVGGTGIGLSISKCLVGLMNGEIGFASTPNVGSTFTFTAVFGTSSSSSDESKCEESTSEFETMRALVVDPRPVRAMVTKYHIRRLKIHVSVRSDLNQCFLDNGTKGINLIFIEHEVWHKDQDASSLFVNRLRSFGSQVVPNLFLLASLNITFRIGSNSSAVITKPLKASLLAACLRRSMGLSNEGSSCSNDAPDGSLLNLLRDRKILIVDDNKVNLLVAAGALRKYGADVVSANSGEEAIKYLKPPHCFDACFMDIQMPTMNGFETTKRIREMETNINAASRRHEGDVDSTKWYVPILAMTADVINATHDECLKYGMDGYVSKPFEAEQLYREVSRVFQPSDFR